MGLIESLKQIERLEQINRSQINNTQMDGDLSYVKTEADMSNKLDISI